MVDARGVTEGGPEPGQVALAREREKCPLCDGELVVTAGAEVCRNRECGYLLLLLDCAACGRIDRWLHHYGARHRWVRLRLGTIPPSVMACSAACAVLLLDETVNSGVLRDVPHRPAAGPAPETGR
ncbi:MAG: hypothetical protein V7637_5536 [Mycobacteriales bacterium]